MIFCYNSEGEHTGTFKTQAEAARQLNTTRVMINQTIHRRSSSNGNYFLSKKKLIEKGMDEHMDDELIHEYAKMYIQTQRKNLQEFIELNVLS